MTEAHAAIREYFEHGFPEDLLYERLGEMRSEPLDLSELACDALSIADDELRTIFELRDQFDLEAGSLSASLGRWNVRYDSCHFEASGNLFEQAVLHAQQVGIVPLMELFGGCVHLGRSRSGFEYLAFFEDQGPTEIVAWRPPGVAIGHSDESVAPLARRVSTVAYLNRLYEDAITRAATPDQLRGAYALIGDDVSTMDDYAMLYDYVGGQPSRQLLFRPSTVRRFYRSFWLALLFTDVEISSREMQEYFLWSLEEGDLDSAFPADALYGLWHSLACGSTDGVERAAHHPSRLVRDSFELFQTAMNKGPLGDLESLPETLTAWQNALRSQRHDWHSDERKRLSETLRAKAEARGAASTGPLREIIESAVEGRWLSHTSESDYPFIYVSTESIPDFENARRIELVDLFPQTSQMLTVHEHDRAAIFPVVAIGDLFRETLEDPQIWLTGEVEREIWILGRVDGRVAGVMTVSIET